MDVSCEQILLNPLGHTANQVKFIIHISNLGARTRSRTTEVEFLVHGRDLAGFKPRILRFHGFLQGRSDVGDAVRNQRS